MKIWEAVDRRQRYSDQRESRPSSPPGRPAFRISSGLPRMR